MSHYQKHIFMCTNQKLEGRKCCANNQAQQMSQTLKSKLQALEMHGPDKFRVSTSGCLGRCSKGPCMVVYPEQTWYSYESESDLDKIIESHLKDGEEVESLLIK